MVRTAADDMVSAGFVTTRFLLLVLALASAPVMARDAGTCSAPGKTGQPCDDGDRCTLDDACNAGLCAGTRVDCADGNVCDGEETCDPATGRCRPGTPLVCDDGDPCTIDQPCDPAGGCIVRRLPDVDFVRCRATGRLPIESCSDVLPPRVRRPLLRMRRVLDRTGRPTSFAQIARTLGRLDRSCRRAKRRLDAAMRRADVPPCFDQQRRALDGVCPDRQAD
jgi:hypothetical protein